LADRPNILWYCSDQQRFDTVGALNNPYVHTPRLDGFMKQSVTMDYAYCQSPICTPSRSSFLTGMYPSAVGVNGNGNESWPEQYAERLLPNMLTRAGYHCGLVGKLHLAGAANARENRVDDGYDYFQYSHAPKGPNDFGHDYAEWLRAQGADPEKLLGEYNKMDSYRQGAKVKSFGGVYEPTSEQDNVPPHLHQTHWCTEKSIEFIDKNRRQDQPWMLSVNPFDPHAAFDPPYEYYQRFDVDEMPGAHFEPSDLAHQQHLTDAGVDFQSKPQHPDEWDHKRVQAAYYAMIEQVDHEFGRILDHLDATGERDNTVIIFMSDHGEALCDHGLLLKGCRFFEGLVRVPLMISWPQKFQQDVVSDSLVELIDVVPTLLDAAGLAIPYWVQGQSLTGVLDGSTDSHRQAVRTEFFGAINYPDQTHATMYRNRQWKLVSYHGKNLFELYDLRADPWEHKDLSNDPLHQDTLRDLIRLSFDAVIAAAPPFASRNMPF
jgi:arylsulfatase A-like enzyme